MRFQWTVAAALLAGCTQSVIAAEAPTTTATSRLAAASLRAAMAGAWTGALGYRDYQTNRLFELPVESTISLEADGVTQVRRTRFDEGPGQAPVWITTTSIDDAKAGTLVSASFRAGRQVELITEKVSLVRQASPRDWQIVYTRSGADADTPADIRVTETRSGNTVLAVKEVKPIGAPDTAYVFRNQLKLVEVDPAAR